MVNKTSISENSIYQLLSTIHDPEIPVLSIQEIGILRKVIIHSEEIEIIITPSYSGCPAMGWIEDEIRTKLNSNGYHQIKITTSYAQNWTTDDFSSSAKEKLRTYGIAPPVHSNCMNWFKSGTLNINCPRCHSLNTSLVSRFGSTACKSLYKCNDCKEPFEYFKCH